MIRKIKKEDEKEFLLMANDFYKSSALEIPLTDDIIINNFNALIDENPYIKGFIFEDDNKNIMGFATISFTFQTEFGGLVLLFEDMYIKEEYQGMGLGSNMFKYLETNYKENINAIKLEVSRVNTRAVDLYSRLGYEINNYIHMTKEI